MKLKKKFKFASKGKQYLEFKQERLMREIKSLWPQYQKMRQKVLSLFKKSLLILNQTYKDMGKTEFEVISMISKIQYDP
ncbi:MAG: V-type ATP synthase subunit D, partial [Promethearchaeia archaeon]